MSNVVYSRQQWDDHMLNLKWKQGEHIGIVAPTGNGKTTLASPLLEKRKHVVALVTKLHDDTVSKDYKGYKRFDRWPKHGFSPTDGNRILLWPKPEKTSAATYRKHQEVMQEALDKILYDGAWCVYMDELLYMTKKLRLENPIEMMHYYGRSSGISAVTSSQRPSHIPLIVLGSITHGYFSRTYVSADQKRLSELGSIDPREVLANMPQLQSRFDYMYLNPQGDAPASIVNRRK